MFASDSRLSGAGFLDASPKVFTLPRSDSIICFASDTYFAYPLILQISQAIQSHYPLKDRAIDYVPFRTHLLKLLNAIFSSFDAYIEEFKNPDTSFLLGGYSWFNKEFCIDRLYYNKGKARFEHSPCQMGIGNFGKVLFIGDWAKQATHNLFEKLMNVHGPDSVGRGSAVDHRFDYEPFEVIVELLRSAKKQDTIGGAPQLAAISQHMNSRHTAVYWPNKQSGNVFLGGRPVFDFENIENWIIDPDTLESGHRQFCRK